MYLFFLFKSYVVNSDVVTYGNQKNGNDERCARVETRRFGGSHQEHRTALVLTVYTWVIQDKKGKSTTKDGISDM